MSERHDIQFLEAQAEIVASPPRSDIDRSFGLPTGLYAATVGSYLAFLAVLAWGLQSRDMIVPMAIFVAYIAMAFGVPALWTRMGPGHSSRAPSMEAFLARGIETHTGHNEGSAAAVQVLILPVLVAVWGIAVVAIASLT